MLFVINKELELIDEDTGGSPGNTELALDGNILLVKWLILDCPLTIPLLSADLATVFPMLPIIPKDNNINDCKTQLQAVYPG